MQYKNLLLICLIFAGAANLKGAEADGKAAAEQANVKLTPEEIARFRACKEAVKKLEAREAREAYWKAREEAKKDDLPIVASVITGFLSACVCDKGIDYLLKTTTTLNRHDREFIRFLPCLFAWVGAGILTFKTIKHFEKKYEKKAE